MINTEHNIEIICVEKTHCKIISHHVVIIVIISVEKMGDDFVVFSISISCIYLGFRFLNECFDRHRINSSTASHTTVHTNSFVANLF